MNVEHSKSWCVTRGAEENAVAAALGRAAGGPTAPVPDEMKELLDRLDRTRGSPRRQR